VVCHLQSSQLKHWHNLSLVCQHQSKLVRRHLYMRIGYCHQLEEPTMKINMPWFIESFSYDSERKGKLIVVNQKPISSCFYLLLQTKWSSIFFHSHLKTTLSCLGLEVRGSAKRWPAQIGLFTFWWQEQSPGDPPCQRMKILVISFRGKDASNQKTFNSNHLNRTQKPHDYYCYRHIVWQVFDFQTQ